MTIGYGIFYIVFGIIGVSLNVAVGLAIALDKSMHNATYLFMIQLAFSDAEAVVGIVFGPGVLMIAGVRDQSNFLVKLCAYMDACGFRVSVFMMVLVAFTRWAHFTHNPFLNQIFTKRNYAAMSAFLWAALHIFYSPFLYDHRAFATLEDDSGAYVYTNATISQLFRYFDESLNYATAGAQIVFNILALYFVLKMRTQVMTPELRAHNWQEIKLFIQCGLDSLIFILFDLFFYYSIYSANNQAWLAVTIEFLLLANHVDCAILYLCFNKKLRASLVSFLKSTERSFREKGRNLPSLANRMVPLQELASNSAQHV